MRDGLDVPEILERPDMLAIFRNFMKGCESKGWCMIDGRNYYSLVALRDAGLMTLSPVTMNLLGEVTSGPVICSQTDAAHFAASLLANDEG